jgi:hypothetical protein
VVGNVCAGIVSHLMRSFGGGSTHSDANAIACEQLRRAYQYSDARMCRSTSASNPSSTYLAWRGVTGMVKALAERRSIEPALPYKFLFSRSLNVAARRSTFLQDVAAGRRTVIDDLNGATVGMGEPAVRKRRSTKRLRR